LVRRRDNLFRIAVLCRVGRYGSDCRGCSDRKIQGHACGLAGWNIGHDHEGRAGHHHRTKAAGAFAAANDQDGHMLFVQRAGDYRTGECGVSVARTRSFCRPNYLRYRGAAGSGSGTCGQPSKKASHRSLQALAVGRVREPGEEHQFRSFRQCSSTRPLEPATHSKAYPPGLDPIPGQRTLTSRITRNCWPSLIRYS
jgi:hypothetical protein